MFFHTERLRPGLTRIWDVAHTAIYLFEGTDKALLVDTGVGVGDLSALVGTLTDKPLVVAMTHGHVDHAMGAGQFDEVYMSPLDREVYLAHSRLEVRRDYVRGAAISGGDSDLISKVTDEDFQPVLPIERFHPLEVGMSFDLGGVTLRVMEGQGHTRGSVTLLIPEWRILILGDACNDFTYLFSADSSPVAEYREMLKRLNAATKGTYDRVLFSHGIGEGDRNMIDCVIEVCGQILRRETDDVPFKGPDGADAFIAKAMDFTRFRRVDGRSGNVVYDPLKLH